MGASKGDESGARRQAAEAVIIELGYNDDTSMTLEQAGKNMRKQTWFTTLSQSRAIVKLVIFVNQPSYRQVAGTRKRKGRAQQFSSGEVIHGSQFVHAAANLVHSELSIATSVLDRPAQELYVGFTVGSDGELWQDIATCCSYTSGGIDYNKNGQPALWYDAQHPSAAGAEAHFRCLISALQKLFQ